MKTKILLLVVFLISPIAFADECKLKTLKGTYIYNSSMYGVQAGMVVYDGKGNFKIKYQTVIVLRPKKHPKEQLLDYLSPQKVKSIHGL